MQLYAVNFIPQLGSLYMFQAVDTVFKIVLLMMGV